VALSILPFLRRDLRLPLGYQRARQWQQGPRAVLFLTLYQIVSYLISIIVMVVIVQFVLSLLISFNVVNMHNHFVESLWRAVNAILEPILAPVRRFMPDTGAIDFSPMVVIILLTILQIVLRNLAYAAI
jgi:YggT family protein